MNTMEAKEIERLKTVLSYNILDTPAEAELDKIAELISLVCEVPIAIISIIDNKRQWYKAKVGVENSEVPVEDSFCQFTLLEDGFLEISDVQSDERVSGKPASQGKDGLKFYAGIPLKAPNGQNIGTACVASSKPHSLSEKQKKAFSLLAEQAMSLIEAKRSNQKLGHELKVIVEQQSTFVNEKLRQKESEINALLRAISLSNGLVQFLPNGTIIETNDIFASYLGLSSNQLIGKHHSELLFEEDQQKNKEFWESLNQGNFKSGQMKRKHSSGKEIWILATYNPIFDDEGKVSKVVKIAQEITTSIESRNELQEAKNQADHLNVQKDNFIANVSHEIRTPIHAILGFTQLLLDEETDLIKKEHLKAVKTAGDNLLFIINDILDLSKIESGTLHIEQLEFSLKKTVQELGSFLKIKAIQKNIDFSVEIEEGVTDYIVGDKNRLGQILINLVGNAIKFTERGFVKLKIELINETISDVSLKFRVIDSGIGIPVEKLTLIFDRFSQSDEKISRRFGGTGLGLNISKSLVEKMNGSIEVSSKEGSGSEFSLTISFQKAEGEKTEIVNSGIDLFKKDEPIKILLFEDNDLNQTLIKKLLPYPNFDLVIADNGEEGILLFETRDFDIILMDIQMPIMDGYQATEYIRENFHTEIPIIALSANYMLKEKQKCFDLGMNDYLSKPFKKEELYEIIFKWTNLDKTMMNAEVNSDQFKPEATIDLNTLREFSGGNVDFEQEMIRMFITQVRGWFEEMKEYILVSDYTKIGESTHKLKSSFGVLGADATDLMVIHDLAEEKNIEEINVVYKRLKQYLNNVIPFLENNLNK